MSETVQVVHFADAGCPWDYSAEPVRIALEERYGEQLQWRSVQVGLHESGEATARHGYTPAGLAASYRIFQERYGMPFCTDERPRLAGTWPGARAVKAAERQSHRAAAALLRRLRLGWFVEARIMDEHEQLVGLGAQIDDLDLDRFKADLDDAGTAAELERDMAEAREPDTIALGLDKTAHPPGDPGPRYSTPTYRFAFQGRTATVPGFQPLAAYEIALHNLAPHLERRPAGDAAGFLRGRPGEPYAAVEIAAAIGRSERRSVEQLEALVAGRSVQRAGAGARELWSWGTPRFDLRCPVLPGLDELLEQELAT